MPPSLQKTVFHVLEPTQRVQNLYKREQVSIHVESSVRLGGYWYSQLWESTFQRTDTTPKFYALRAYSTQYQVQKKRVTLFERTASNAIYVLLASTHRLPRNTRICAAEYAFRKYNVSGWSSSFTFGRWSSDTAYNIDKFQLSQ